MGATFHQSSGRLISRLVCLCVFSLCALQASAEGADSMILCREEVVAERRQELSEKLRAISGWPGLHFDADCVLRFGDAPPVGGSPAARTLLSNAQAGQNLIVVEDASGRADVVFGRVVPGRWKRGATNQTNQPPVFIVQIDFTDFSHVMGDERARAAFNAGWGFLHEVNHVVHDSVDADGLGMLGECESAVNVMRRECGLAERADYFFTFVPGADRSTFKTRFVRLPFDAPHENDKRRRYWLYWDAALTGGLPPTSQSAAK
jgi:hypothetical protein